MQDFVDETRALIERPCVYVLLEKGVIQYVGQTIELANRIKAHRKKLRFDQVMVKYCRREEMAHIEHCAIRDLKPPLNKAGTKRVEYTKPVDLVRLGLVAPKPTWRRF